MTVHSSPRNGPVSERQFPTRREILAAATAALASAAAGSPAQAAVGAEGYFLVFDSPGGPQNAHLDRLFYIPSAWLELFELTDVYKTRFPSPTPGSGWKQALHRIRTSNPPGRKWKFSVLYSDSMDAGVFEPFPDATVIPAAPPTGNQTYLAAMVAPIDLPT